MMIFMYMAVNTYINTNFVIKHDCNINGMIHNMMWKNNLHDSILCKTVIHVGSKIYRIKTMINRL